LRGKAKPFRPNVGRHIGPCAKCTLLSISEPMS
jgi:hypothetical protein